MEFGGNKDEAVACCDKRPINTLIHRPPAFSSVQLFTTPHPQTLPSCNRGKYIKLLEKSPFAVSYFISMNVCICHLLLFITLCKKIYFLISCRQGDGNKVFHSNCIMAKNTIICSELEQFWSFPRRKFLYLCFRLLAGSQWAGLSWKNMMSHTTFDNNNVIMSAVLLPGNQN